MMNAKGDIPCVALPTLFFGRVILTVIFTIAVLIVFLLFKLEPLNIAGWITKLVLIVLCSIVMVYCGAGAIVRTYLQVDNTPPQISLQVSVANYALYTKTLITGNKTLVIRDAVVRVPFTRRKGIAIAILGDNHEPEPHLIFEADDEGKNMAQRILALYAEAIKSYNNDLNM